MGVYLTDAQSFIEKLAHQKSVIVDGSQWLQPSTDSSLIRYSHTNLPPDKTEQNITEGVTSVSENRCYAKADRKIWWLAKCQFATIPHPTWNLCWPVMMEQFLKIRNRMCSRDDSPLADCFDWRSGTCTSYSNHGGLVRISIPLRGRTKFKEQALKDGWEEYCHLTSLKCLPSILECGILLPANVSGMRSDCGPETDGEGQKPKVNCCQWVDGPDARLKYATFS